MAEVPEKRRRGRPKGSKNRPKVTSADDSPNKPVDGGQELVDGREQFEDEFDDEFDDEADEADEDPRYLAEVKDLEDRVQDSIDSVWETESLFEDVIEDLAEDKAFVDDPEACTPEEAVMYRQQLRAIGPEEFCRRTVDAGLISAKKLLTAFGIRAPAFLDGSDDTAYFGLLSLALSRELSKRAKLMRYNTVDDAVDLLRRSSNIIVLTGAGISTSLGIPDFRSKGTGLYAKLEHLGLSDPQEVFDISLFREDPSYFYSVARDILPSTDRFTPTHAFIALLDRMGKLLTNYSQNIDNLEAKAGISPDRVVQCHGSFATASCMRCGHKVVGETIFPDIRAGRIPKCQRCTQAALAAASVAGGRHTKRKRSRNGSNGPGGKKTANGRRYDSQSDDEDDDDDDGHDIAQQIGIMKPDITFFGEALPDLFSRRLTEHDRDRVDLVVVIGTSLKVAPVSEVVPYLPPHIPQIYISRTPVSHVNFDIDLLGDCDIVVAELCRRAGWDLRHEMIPKDQRVEVRTEDGWASRHIFSQVWPEIVKPEEEKRSDEQRGSLGRTLRQVQDEEDEDEDEDEEDEEDEEEDEEEKTPSLPSRKSRSPTKRAA